jgi:hypothetical protein
MAAHSILSIFSERPDAAGLGADLDNAVFTPALRTLHSLGDSAS